MRGVSTSHVRAGWKQGLVLSALLALPLAMVSCGGGDDGGGSAGGSGGGGGGGGGNTTTQFAYAINAGSGTIQAYRSDADGNLTSIGVAVRTGDFPHHVDVDARGRFVYVSNHNSPFVSGYRINSDGTLAQIDPASGSPVTGSDASENQPHSSVIDNTGQFLYVVAGPEAGATSTLRAYLINTTPTNTGTVTFIPTQSFSVGVHAHNIAISSNNQFVYVASEGSGEVHAFSRNPTTGTLLSAGTVGGLIQPSAVAVDPQNRFAYVTMLNSVEVFQIGSNGALTRIAGANSFPTGNSPHSVAIHPNGQTLYTANLNAANISVFRVNATTGALTPVQTAATGSDPNYVAIHPNGRALYTADAGLDRVSRFTINADGTLVLPPSVVPGGGDGTNGIGTTKL